MKFEEVLPLMREGKKARHNRMIDGEWWICGKAEFPGVIDSWPTLIKVFQNPFENEKHADSGVYSWGISRWEIMCEDWEVAE